MPIILTFYSKKLDETYPDANPDAKTDVRSPVCSEEKTCYSKDEHQSPKYHLCVGQPSQSSCSVHHDCNQIGEKSNIRSYAKNSRLQCLGLANVTLPWLGWGI